MMTATLNAALSYAEHGWPVFPVGKDKAPLTKHGFQDATVHAGLIEEWWGTQYPVANVALAIPEGIVVLDFDPRNGAPEPEVFNWGTYPMDGTLRCETPSGGAHLYFTVPAGTELVGKWMPGIDVKAGGKGYVLLPPSDNGEKMYTWYRGEQDGEVGRIAELPAWVLKAITKTPVAYDLGLASAMAEPTFAWDLGTSYGMFGLQAMLGLVAMAENGERNNCLNRAAYRIGQYVAAGEVKEDALFHLARVAEWVGLDRDEIGITIRSAYEAGTRKAWTR